MIRKSDKSTTYTAFMYETPYKLPAIEGYRVNGDLYSKKVEKDEENNQIIYTFCLVNGDRNESEPQHVVSTKMCKFGENELDLFLTKPVLYYTPYTDDSWEKSNEKLMLDLHNQARLDYANITEPMLYDFELENIAQQHAEYMALTGDFAHTTEDGVTVLDRYINNGLIPGEDFYFFGENILYTTPDYDGFYGTNNMIKEMFRMWKESPPHWENILKPEFDRIGFGYSMGIININGQSHNVIYGVVNFAGGGTYNSKKYGVLYDVLKENIGHNSIFELRYEANIDTNYNLNLLLAETVNLTFVYKAPLLCAINHLTLHKSTQAVSSSSIYWHNTELGIIGETKKDALQIAGNEYRYTIKEWGDFAIHAPGMFYFCTFSIDKYIGEYPYSTFFQNQDKVIYIGNFLKLFGLTGGRIKNISIDTEGKHIYSIDIEDKIYYVYASGSETYNINDYVIVTKTNNKVDAGYRYSLIGNGRDNSPNNIIGFTTNLNHKNVKTINEQEDNYYILPISPLDLPM